MSVFGTGTSNTLACTKFNMARVVVVVVVVSYGHTNPCNSKSRCGHGSCTRIKT